MQVYTQISKCKQNRKTLPLVIRILSVYIVLLYFLHKFILFNYKFVNIYLIVLNCTFLSQSVYAIGFFFAPN